MVAEKLYCSCCRHKLTKWMFGWAGHDSVCARFGKGPDA